MKTKGYKNSIDFRLLVITDNHLAKDNTLESIVEKCCGNGVRAIQLREKDISAKKLFDISKRLRKITRKHSAKLVINDRLDIALLSKSDGVHSPEQGIKAEDIRKINSKLLTGKSVHSQTSAVEAERDGYDYIIFGPVFRTPLKVKYGKPQGLKKLKEVCQAVGIPVFAVGGITPDRSGRCIDCGAHGVTVIGAVFRSTDLKKTLREFRTSLGCL